MNGTLTVAKEIPDYLKLHVEESSSDEGRPEPAPALEEIPGLDQYCRSFERATGWRLSVQDQDSEAAFSPARGLSKSTTLRPVVKLSGDFADEMTAASLAPIEGDQAQELADAFTPLVSELQQTREELWRREAELAAGIPVSAREDEAAHLAIRLESILKGGAQALGCQRAAAYLLDDATTQLKLRACWGLPKQRLLAPARPLRGAVADLEALMGHAVALEDAQLLPHWKVPEPCASAVCVPIASPTEPLGTLWYFCDRVRTFADEQTGLAEIIAGRIASELQREILLNEHISTRELDRQLVRAARWQQERLPNIKPLLDEWDIAGWSSFSAMPSPAFHDWFAPSDGSLAVAVGTAEGSMMESALTAAALQSAVRAHSAHPHDAAQMLNRIDETFWRSSAGGQLASLFYGLIQPDRGNVSWSLSGKIDAFAISRQQCKRLEGSSVLLGSDPDTQRRANRRPVAPGDAVVVGSRGLLGSGDSATDRGTGGLARLAAESGTAQQLADAIRQEATGAEGAAGSALLVVKRRR